MAGRIEQTSIMFSLQESAKPCKAGSTFKGLTRLSPLAVELPCQAHIHAPVTGKAAKTADRALFFMCGPRLLKALTCAVAAPHSDKVPDRNIGTVVARKLQELLDPSSIEKPRRCRLAQLRVVNPEYLRQESATYRLDCTTWKRSTSLQGSK
eukprot:6205407-Pleurochrysis_carterae.AAC.2